MEILYALAFIGIWFILQAWVLPRFGISTWLSGHCGPSSAQKTIGQPSEPNDQLPEQQGEADDR